MTERGTVTYDISPKDGDLKLIPVDTTWIKQVCNTYKEYKYASISIGGYGYLTTTNDNNLWVNANLNTDYIITESVKEKFTTNISRQKVCKVKLREPTQQGFWEWLKTKGYRK